MRALVKFAREIDVNKHSLWGFALFVVCAFLVSFIAACSIPQTGPANPIQIPQPTGDGWETASLEAAGLDPAPLVVMLGDIQDGGYDNLHSLLIVKM